jgi:hypothetical protein
MDYKRRYPIDDRAVLLELGYTLVTRKPNFYSLPCAALQTHDPLAVCEEVRNLLDVDYYTLDYEYSNGWMYFYHL